MSRGWVRELVALAVALALAAGAVAWTLRLNWFPYRDKQPVQITRVTAGESGVLGASELTVTETKLIAGDSERGQRLEVAEDATLVIVSLDVVPQLESKDPQPCRLLLVDPRAKSDLEETRWDTASFSDTSYSAPDRFESYCDDATEPYALQMTYVVPTEVASSVELEVTDLELIPRALRLELDGDAPPAS